MTNTEFNTIMKRYRFDDYIKAESVRIAHKNLCLHWLEELEREGYVGLTSAVNNYNDKFGGNTEEANSFVSYVTKYISGYMHKFLNSYSRTVRVPENVIYQKNRDFDISENKVDISDYRYDQIDPDSEDSLNGEYFEQDEMWLANKAIEDTFKKVKETDRIGPQKVKAFRMLNRLGEYREIVITLNEIARITGINTTTIRRCNFEIQFLIKERYNNLCNKLKKIELRRNGIQHST